METVRVLQQSRRDAWEARMTRSTKEAQVAQFCWNRGCTQRMGTELGQHEALVYGAKKSDFLESKPMELKTQFGFI